MATWGQKTILIDKYKPERSLYYDYNTTVDSYYLNYMGSEDHGMGYENFDIEYRFGNQEGEAIMEALINHILAFECSGDEQQFIDRYIKNNRFITEPVK